MNVLAIKLNSLRNQEHYQFGTDVITIIKKHRPDVLKLDAELVQFADLHDELGTVLNLVDKSVSTNSLSDLDKVRDRLFRGFALSIEAGCHHFDEQKREAAERLSLVLDEYGNVARKSYDAESAALGKLSAEAKSIYLVDVKLLGLLEWADRMEAANNEFQEEMYRRYSESASKPAGVVRDLREAADQAYYKLPEKLNAYMLITGGDRYKAAIAELNICIEKYRNMLAVRMGRSKAKAEAEKAKATNAAGGEE